MSDTGDGVDEQDLSHTQREAIRRLQDALPGVAHTVTFLRRTLTRSCEGVEPPPAIAELCRQLDVCGDAIAHSERVAGAQDLGTPIEKLKLDPHLTKALQRPSSCCEGGIRTIPQLATYTEQDLRDIRGVSPAGIVQIKIALRRRGIVLPPNEV